ncbi:11893_t:CDS:1, partial [Acaulospora morrowiae]
NITQIRCSINPESRQCVMSNIHKEAERIELPTVPPACYGD